jgi:multiple sugar transport system ATP-binding protein
MAEVSIRGLTKTFGDTVAVDDLSLSIGDGEFMVLVGPSGCGKSTVLRCIAGLEEADRGEIEIGGRRVDDLEPRHRNVAMVFQNYALYPHMTVAENLAFPLKMARVARQDRDVKVRAIAGVLGLEEMLDRKPRTLSGGQMQRVALGRAMIRDPSVFLFDEPLSNLDAKMRLEMRAEIARLHKRLGATMIYVTHDQAEAMTLGDRIAVMEEGVMQQVGPPMEVYRRPENRFVAGFIGTPPMNFMGDVGIRPHDVVVEDDGPVEADVELVEPMGAETYVHCRVGEDRVMVVTQDPPDGDRIRLRFPEDKMHRFE